MRISWIMCMCSSAILFFSAPNTLALFRRLYRYNTNIIKLCNCCPFSRRFSWPIVCSPIRSVVEYYFWNQCCALIYMICHNMSSIILYYSLIIIDSFHDALALFPCIAVSCHVLVSLVIGFTSPSRLLVYYFRGKPSFGHLITSNFMLVLHWRDMLCYSAVSSYSLYVSFNLNGSMIVWDGINIP